MIPTRSGSKPFSPESASASRLQPTAIDTQRSSLRASLAETDGGRVEVLDLARDPHREVARVEGLDEVDAALARERGAPGRRHVEPERRDRPDAGDGYPQLRAVQALDACSFSVERGRMLGFLGPNGAGKTTAMRAVFGISRSSTPATCSGTGRPVGEAERMRFGYMPEERGLYPRMRVGEQLEYFARLHGLSPRTARGAVGALARAARPR